MVVSYKILRKNLPFLRIGNRRATGGRRSFETLKRLCNEHRYIIYEWLTFNGIEANKEYTSTRGVSGTFMNHTGYDLDFIPVIRVSDDFIYLLMSFCF